MRTRSFQLVKSRYGSKMRVKREVLLVGCPSQDAAADREVQEVDGDQEHPIDRVEVQLSPVDPICREAQDSEPSKL